jgi:hypothetical protein
VLPVRFGYVAGLATGVLILLGVLQPGLATWPALVWLMASGVALALLPENSEHSENSEHAGADEPDQRAEPPAPDPATAIPD